MYDVKRTIFPQIEYLLENFPCVAVLGSRQVGKTTLLKQILPDAPFFDLEKASDFTKIEPDTEFFLQQFDECVVLDESQLLPSLFPALRVKIDSNRSKMGQFLLSGSSSPELLKNVTESLAGRVAIVELSGFSLEEAWQKKPSELYEIINNKQFKDLKLLKPTYQNEELWQLCIKGGYPEAFLMGNKNSKRFELWMENYFDTYVQRDIRRLFPQLDINNYRKLISMLSHSSGKILNYSDFARSLDISQPTVKSYIQIFEGTFLWRNLPSYEKNVIKRVVKMPKGHIRDTGLINHLLRIRNKEDLLGHPLAGSIWESLIIEEIIKGFKNRLINVDYYYYRTQHQAEIDLLIEGDFGLIPIEVKLGTQINKNQLFTLKDFIKHHNLEFGLIINNSDKLCWISPQIFQLPATYL